MKIKVARSQWQVNISIKLALQVARIDLSCRVFVLCALYCNLQQSANTAHGGSRSHRLTAQGTAAQHTLHSERREQTFLIIFYNLFKCSAANALSIFNSQIYLRVPFIKTDYCIFILPAEMKLNSKNPVLDDLSKYIFN